MYPRNSSENTFPAAEAFHRAYGWVGGLALVVALGCSGASKSPGADREEETSSTEGDEGPAPSTTSEADTGTSSLTDTSGYPTSGVAVSTGEESSTTNMGTGTTMAETEDTDQSSSSGSTGDSGGTGAVEEGAYRECSRAGACFTEECAFDNGSTNTCCLDYGTCAPICDGNVDLCPAAPEGFNVYCGTQGTTEGHCLVACSDDGTCPEGMSCSLQLGPPTCVFEEL